MPKGKKRALEEEEAAQAATPKPKKSKKEIREEAMRRAKESMQADKQKVEAVKAKKQGFTPAKAAASPAKKAKAPEKKPVSTKKTAANAIKSPDGKKAPKATANMPPVQPAAAAAQQLPQGVGYGMMQPGAGAPANQAMVAHYMQQQQQMQQPQMYGNPVPYYNMGQQPYGGGFGGQFPGQFVPMNNLAMQQAQAAQAQNAYKTQPTAKPKARPQPAGPALVPPSHQPTAPASPPKKAATAIPESDEDDDDFMPPPPTAQLEMQISQQVLANVAALNNNEPIRFDKPPPEAFTTEHSTQLDDDGDEEVYDDQPIIVDDVHYPSLVKKKSGKGLIVAILVAIVSVAVVFFLDASEDSSETKAAVKSDHACYYDSVELDTEDYVPACSNEPGGPCPDGGVCEGGQLVACQYWFEEVSNDKKSCVLPAESQKTLETIIEVLAEKTVESKCSLLSFRSRPFFDYAQVQLVRPMELATNPLELAVLEKSLISERRGGKFMIALPDQYLPELNLSCRVTVSIKSFFARCASAVLYVIGQLLSWTVLTFFDYPLYSTIALVIIFIARKRRQYEAYRSKLVRDIAQVRQMAYELLQDRPSDSHVVLHVRDEISMTLYPDSNSQRKYLAKEVWPRIVPDFTQDNRVLKSKVLIEGRELDAWQWAATTPGKKAAVVRGQ